MLRLFVVACTDLHICIRIRLFEFNIVAPEPPNLLRVWWTAVLMLDLALCPRTYILAWR